MDHIHYWSVGVVLEMLPHWLPGSKYGLKKKSQGGKKKRLKTRYGKTLYGAFSAVCLSLLHQQEESLLSGALMFLQDWVTALFPSALQSEGFHACTDILSHGTAEGNSLGGPWAYVESNLLHTGPRRPSVRCGPGAALHGARYTTTTIPRAEFRKCGNCRVW